MSLRGSLDILCQDNAVQALKAFRLDEKQSPSLCQEIASSSRYYISGFPRNDMLWREDVAGKTPVQVAIQWLILGA